MRTILTIILLSLASPAFATCGSASWYYMPGAKTASGERMNPKIPTAAHKSIKFGTVLLVKNQANGKSIKVVINDRGPFVKGRILDLNRFAAKKLGFINAGHTKVCYEVIG